RHRADVLNARQVQLEFVINDRSKAQVVMEGQARALAEQQRRFDDLKAEKMLIDSFSPERRNSFKAVVLVQHPREGTYAFGFVTSQLLLEAPAGKGEMVTVFVPSNNLYLGDIIVVPDADVIHTGLSVEEGIRIILSAGTA